MVEKPEGVMKNGVSRDTGATLGKRHRMNILIKFPAYSFNLYR